MYLFRSHSIHLFWLNPEGSRPLAAGGGAEEVVGVDLEVDVEVLVEVLVEALVDFVDVVEAVVGVGL